MSIVGSAGRGSNLTHVAVPHLCSGFGSRQTLRRVYPARAAIQQPVAIHYSPTLLMGPGNHLFNDNRSRTPDTGAKPWIDVGVLRAQPRLPASRHLLSFGIPELEMLIRKHPGPKLRLRERHNLGVLLAHETPFSNRGLRRIASQGGADWRHPRSEIPASTRRRSARNGRYHRRPRTSPSNPQTEVAPEFGVPSLYR